MIKLSEVFAAVAVVVAYIYNKLPNVHRLKS